MEVTVDQGLRVFPSPTRKLEPVRFEFVTSRVALVQCLPLRDEGAERFL